jgi:CheY-like chemotaxis protein
MTSRPATVLLVDDDEIDCETVQRAFRKLQLSNPITVAQDGVEALEILRTPENGVPRPYLILLDLNMPRMGGLEFLEELRRDELLHDSIVFVLTTSDAERDKRAAYEHHVAGYMVKSNLGDGFADLARVLGQYTQTVEFPPARKSLFN